VKKKHVSSFQMQISCGQSFKNFFYTFLTNLAQDPMVRYAKKNIWIFLHFAIEMAIFIGIWWIKGLGILEASR